MIEEHEMKLKRGEKLIVIFFVFLLGRYLRRRKEGKEGSPLWTMREKYD